MSRKLASVKRITKIFPIPDAHSIECAEVDYGWQVIVKKGEFQVNSLAIYLEIDSWVPNELAPFLAKKKSKEFNGVFGERLRTIKLRGQISQGLLLPLTKDIPENTDLTQELKIQKWEHPSEIPIRKTGDPFPSFIRKTDQERCQNLANKLFGNYQNEEFEVTIKLDGSSITIYKMDGHVGVCSRNFEQPQDNTSYYWMAAVQQNLINAIRCYPQNIAIQGELIGEKFQGNPEKIKGHRIYLFDIFDISNNCYIRSKQRMQILKELQEFGADLQHIPILSEKQSLSNFHTISDFLEYAEGPSMNTNIIREGLVFKHIHSDFSFKAISNTYLLQQK